MSEASGSPAYTSQAMRVTVDHEAGATYVHLDEGPRVARTVSLSDTVNVDLDEHGKPVGVEVLW